MAVQAGIDEVKNSGVFVLATANIIRKLPFSLVRLGRFDRKIQVECPSDKDAEEIIAHYLSDKKVSESVNIQKHFSRLPPTLMDWMGNNVKDGGFLCGS